MLIGVRLQSHASVQYCCSIQDAFACVSGLSMWLQVVLGQAIHQVDELLPSSSLPFDDIAAAVLLVFFGIRTLQVILNTTATGDAIVLIQIDHIMVDYVGSASLNNQDGSTCCATMCHLQNVFAARALTLQGVKSIHMSWDSKLSGHAVMTLCRRPARLTQRL